MKVGKILIATIVITVLHVVWGIVTCGNLFNWVYKLEPVAVWKPMDDLSFMPMMIAGTFVLNLIFVAIYAAIKNGLPGKTALAKGVVYGLFVWALGCLPGMFSTYLFMAINTTVVVYWLVNGLVFAPICGAVTAVIVGKCSCQE